MHEKLPVNNHVQVDQLNHVEACQQAKTTIKGKLKPKISLLHMKVITLIKAKSNVFL